MKKIENMIIKRDRNQYYNYFISLGYDHKTATSLALFTYGDYRFDTFSMDDLYDALCKGKEYIPPEEVERRKRWEKGGQMHYKRAYGPVYEGSISNGSTFMDKMKDLVGLCDEEDFDCEYEGTYDNGLDAVEVPLEDCGAISEPEFLQHIKPVPARIGVGANLMNIAGALGYSTDEYEPIEEKDARGVTVEPTSNFRMTTNTASAGIILNQLRNERRIDRSMVRIEEMLNYFRYESDIPEDKKFNLSTEMMDLENGNKYLYINVQGCEEVKEQQNIVIVLDVSGSMGGNTDQTQAIVATIISKLGNGDKLSLITYSDEDIVEMEAFTINGEEDRIHALEKLLSIEITGCTYGSKGIETAYKIGKKNFIEEGNNQVILITDGDLNFGITDKGGLEELIEKKKKDNLFLSVIGTGLYNYKDDKLEALCKHGNGVYRTVNNLNDVKKSIDEEYSSLVNIIAKDVKGQVEFNPELVDSYRLLGFENRTISREDFTNDKVISEPFGSGGYGVALYELTMRTDKTPIDSGLKYSTMATTGSSELGTIKVRYKEPLEDVSSEIEKVVESSDSSYTDNLRLAFIVYVCAEKLRGSDKISEAEVGLAKKMYQELGDQIKQKNSADLYKLAGILDKTEKELGIGISDEPFAW